MTSMPLADPWSIADAPTELPTREFYIIADLLFDALDKRFEPKKTGMLEASKIMESWRVHELAEEAARKLTFPVYGGVPTDMLQSSSRTTASVPSPDSGPSKAFRTSWSLLRPP
jgi:hypothetical protein